jgi:hypothetical protein
MQRHTRSRCRRRPRGGPPPQLHLLPHHHAQNGFGRDVEPFLALSRETWGEEILFDAVKDLPHGALQKRGSSGAPMYERNERGQFLRNVHGHIIPVMDPYGLQRTRLMYAAQAGAVARVKVAAGAWRAGGAKGL